MTIKIRPSFLRPCIYLLDATKDINIITANFSIFHGPLPSTLHLFQCFPGTFTDLKKLVSLPKRM